MAEQETAGAPLTWSVDLQAPARVLGAVVHVARPDAVTGTRAAIFKLLYEMSVAYL